MPAWLAVGTTQPSSTPPSLTGGHHHHPYLCLLPFFLLQFFRLYADRVPANLFDRLRYIIQVRAHPCAAKALEAL